MDRYRGDPSVANRVDDSLGYADGDQLSIEVARRLTRVVAEQLPESRLSGARLGGDEFGIIVMPAGEALARGAAETLLAEVEKPLKTSFIASFIASFFAIDSPWCDVIPFWPRRMRLKSSRAGSLP